MFYYVARCAQAQALRARPPRTLSRVEKETRRTRPLSWLRSSGRRMRSSGQRVRLDLLHTIVLKSITLVCVPNRHCRPSCVRNSEAPRGTPFNRFPTGRSVNRRSGTCLAAPTLARQTTQHDMHAKGKVPHHEKRYGGICIRRDLTVPAGARSVSDQNCALLPTSDARLFRKLCALTPENGAHSLDA